jgi:hypothetical protein
MPNVTLHLAVGFMMRLRPRKPHRAVTRHSNVAQLKMTASRYQSNRPRIDQTPHLVTFFSASSNRHDRQVKSLTTDI